MASNEVFKSVVWERKNKTGKWCPYSTEISQFLEKYYKMNENSVCLGDADPSMKIYSVDLKEMVQVSETTGTKSAIRRQVYDDPVLERGYMWQWRGDGNTWHSYDVDVNNHIETAFLQGKKSVSLSKTFHGYSYAIDFTKMIQINKHTKRKRPIRRQQNVSPYPVERSTDFNIADQKTCENNPSAPMSDIYSRIKEEVPGTSELLCQVNAYMNNVKKRPTMDNIENAYSASSENNQRKIIKHSEECEVSCTNREKKEKSKLDPSLYTIGATAALVDGKPWTGHRPPHTPESKLKPVPGIEPIPKEEKRKHQNKKKEPPDNINEAKSIIEQYSERVVVESSTEDQVCIICCENLSQGSSYDGDKTVVKLSLCSHTFHAACLEAMYNSGSKEKFIQCPTCKKIHGEKCGIQPPGSMIYHVLPYSLPGYPEYETIRIIYNFSSGVQGPGQPNPGKKYTARGFPRHCYLPDNEKGRKVLRLLIKAWKRKLIFTIGRSSTTGEENTVTWNEIHHKTEFGCNKHGHGYPDPNYLDNVLAELEAHGVTDDVYCWFPAE